jgi:hypothetical protein
MVNNAAMLLSGRRKRADAPPGCQAMFVHGVRYANSAAKFWPSLVDEARELHPDCSRMELVTLSAGGLFAEQLYPELELEREVARAETIDVARAMRETLAVLEIAGPPASVGIKLFAGRRRVRTRVLPADCVDGEVFTFLTVWLLRWACLPAAQWNGERVAGRFAAEDRQRRLAYRLALRLANEHLSEGLYRRKLTLWPAVAPMD